MLKFHPREGLMAMVPSTGVDGQSTRYVGRKLDPKTGHFPAVEKPFECEADSPRAARMKKLVSRGEVWPADEATARECGVQFIPVAIVDGEFQPVPVPAKADSTAKRSRSADE